MISLSFHGAAGMVTGSKYLLNVNDERVLIDCGMFQGRRELRQRNWDPPGFKTETLCAVILTHGHLDHIGYLPRLVRFGYNGPVYASHPTVDIAKMSLLDAAHIQMEDAEYRNKKKLTRHEKALPLFDDDDVAAIENLYRPTPFETWTDVTDHIRFRYHFAGHILGAASVEIEVTDGDRKTSVLFSGDIGRYGNPLTRNPGEPPETDYLVCESTYGGRIHPPEDAHQDFIDLVRDAVKRKSILLIPAFAIGRTQQVTFLIDRLIEHGLVPEVEIHIDSPMAISATDIYCKYASMHSIDISQLGGKGCVLNGKRVQLHRKRKSSKQLNKIKGPAIILSSSGMLTGGRVMHHLINRLPDPRTTVALVGYMAEGTLGRRLVDGEKLVYIHKQPIEVKARVEVLAGLSGHADYYELLHWAEPIKKAPRRVFITHGEPDQSEAMAGHFRSKYSWNCYRPSLGETVEL
ncbi:MBL fold metallo-hydrolase [bacterium]|nr:MBL fold metallo-hydrolase [bacterium]